MLPRPLRLTKPAEFARVYRQGKQVSSPHLRLFSLSARGQDIPSDQNHSRFGFVISKKQVSKIVSRNRIKRILRAEVAAAYPKLVSGFLGVIQARPGIIKLPAKEIRAELSTLLLRARILKP